MSVRLHWRVDCVAGLDEAGPGIISNPIESVREWKRCSDSSHCWIPDDQTLARIGVPNPERMCPPALPRGPESGKYDRPAPAFPRKFSVLTDQYFTWQGLGDSEGVIDAFSDVHPGLGERLIPRNDNGNTSIQQDPWPCLIADTPQNDGLSSGHGVKMLHIFGDAPGQFPVATNHPIFSAGDDEI